MQTTLICRKLQNYRSKTASSHFSLRQTCFIKKGFKHRFHLDWLKSELFGVHGLSAAWSSAVSTTTLSKPQSEEKKKKKKKKKKRYWVLPRTVLALLNSRLRYAGQQLHPLPVLTLWIVGLKEALIHLHVSLGGGCRAQPRPTTTEIWRLRPRTETHTLTLVRNNRRMIELFKFMSISAAQSCMSFTLHCTVGVSLHV